MHTWHWHTWNNLPYLTSSLLKQWNHGFFTSAFSPRSPEEMVDVLQPDAQVYRVKQVHGNTVLTPGEIESTENGEPDSNKPPADGIISEEGNQAVWVCTADCTPLLIGDIETGQVAAIHAGWRGTAQRILPNAIARLLNNGSRKDNLRIALGPAITGECYQVSETVAAEVGASIVSTDQGNSTESILGVLQQLDDSPILEDPKPGRVRLDVRRVNVLQLEQLGIDSEQIAIAPHCTYSEPERFFSYRRNQLKKVQWSGIISY